MKKILKYLAHCLELIKCSINVTVIIFVVQNKILAGCTLKRQ